MSTITKKKSGKGVRYSDAQKKEIVDYAVSYNAANGRGGQSKAAEKYNVSQLTISTWLKAAGAPKAVKAPKAPKAAKAAKAPKAPKAAKAGKKGTRSRYSDEQKKEVTDFVATYNESNGRGGASKASKQFSISPLTVVAWLKAAGVKGPAKKAIGKGKPAAASKVAKVGKSSISAPTTGIGAKLSELLALSEQISAAENTLAGLTAKFATLKASL